MIKDRPSRPRASNPEYPYLRFVPCQVQPGLFRDEYLVTVDGVDPAEPDQVIRAQLFVDGDQVRGLTGIPETDRPVDGWLQVALADHDGPYARVVLPQPAVPVGERLYVREDLLREAIGQP